MEKGRDLKAAPATAQISVTLPVKAFELLQHVSETGLAGSTRAEVARTLILRGLEDFIAKGVIERARALAREGGRHEPST